MWVLLVFVLGEDYISMAEFDEATGSPWAQRSPSGLCVEAVNRDRLRMPMRVVEAVVPNRTADAASRVQTMLCTATRMIPMREVW